MYAKSPYFSSHARRFWLGAAIFFALLPLSFVFQLGQMTWFMMRDLPLLAGSAWVLACVCGLAFVRASMDDRR
jgi:hypothetical protein